MAIDASIVVNDNKVYLTKVCPDHGEKTTLISPDAHCYEELYSLYDSLGIPKKYHQAHNRYTVYCTSRCNMNCPICVISANDTPSREFSISDILMLFKRRNIRGKKISLFGGEPTTREDLPELIASIRKSGNSVTLFSNGIRLAEKSYLQKLKDSGLKDIYLQFDGFDRQVEAMTRGADWLDYKFRALENINNLKMPVVFEVTTSREYNFKEIQPIFEYAIKNNFIRGICFRSYSMFGRKKLQFPRLCTEDMISEFTRFTNDKITKAEILVFTKLLFVLAYIFKFKCCFSHRYLMLKRTKDGGYQTMSDYFNVDKINKRLIKFSKLMQNNRILGNAYLFLILIPGLICIKSLSCLLDFLKAVGGYKLGKIFSNSSFGKAYLIIEFDSSCDPLTAELDKVCNTATIMENLLILPSFYDSALRKERESLLAKKL